jgi:non-canonical purine NTP pyrophosphatase, rdgB/HAM1 family
MTIGIALAGGNLSKKKELCSLLEQSHLKVVADSVVESVSVAENGLTFIENALIKARAACKKYYSSAIGDDSGLEVFALDGRPGIHTARYADKSENNIEKLLDEMRSVPIQKRQANFVCVLVFLKHEHDAAPLIAQGFWQGEIAFAPQGDQGFGYDPIFWIPEYRCTAAKLSFEIKNQISHRAKAVNELINKIKERYGKSFN